MAKRKKKAPWSLQFTAIVVGGALVAAPLSVPLAETVVTVGAPSSDISLRAFDAFTNLSLIYMGAITSVFMVDRVSNGKD